MKAYRLMMLSPKEKMRGLQESRDEICSVSLVKRVFLREQQ